MPEFEPKVRFRALGQHIELLVRGGSEALSKKVKSREGGVSSVAVLKDRGKSKTLHHNIYQSLNVESVFDCLEKGLNVFEQNIRIGRLLYSLIVKDSPSWPPILL